MNKQDLVEAGAEEIMYMVEWFSLQEATDLADRIFEVWDKAFGAFETYDEYNSPQMDLFYDQGDLFDDRQSV